MQVALLWSPAVSISVKCPKCGTGLRVPDHAPGKKVRCAGCQEVFVVPAAQAASGPAAPADVAPTEPWQRFAKYVKIAPGLHDTAVRNKMRFQFVFADKSDADRVLDLLSSEVLGALRRGDCWFRGVNKQGKYQLAWNNVEMSIGEGKSLLNCVAKAGGEIFEALME